jgi:hypothetical protein
MKKKRGAKMNFLTGLLSCVAFFLLLSVLSFSILEDAAALSQPRSFPSVAFSSDV